MLSTQVQPATSYIFVPIAQRNVGSPVREPSANTSAVFGMFCESSCAKDKYTTQRRGTERIILPLCYGHRGKGYG